MRLPSQMMTMGTALRYAQDNGTVVRVFTNQHEHQGTVADMDGQGVLLVDSGIATVVRLEAINAVQTLVAEGDLEGIALPASEAVRA